MTKPLPTTLPATRDTRIDVIRALALITIFINHVPNNPFEPFTSKNFGFSDAAEAFVLISGISAAFAYGLKFQPGMALPTTLKVWRRAGVLYIAQLGTTMATIGIFAFFALRFATPELLEKINIGPIMDQTAESLLGIVTFGHQLGYNNILSMYAVVLLLIPAFLLIGRYGLGWMVAASGALWFAAGLFRIGPPNFPNEGVWFLNPLSWQFLFVIGLASMIHVKRGGSLPVNKWLVGGAAAYLAVSLAWVQVPLWGIDVSMGLPNVLTGFEKTYLSGPRLLHVLAAAYLVAVLPWVSGVARLSDTNPLAVMGRHALPVFVTGTILSMAAQAFRETHESDFLTDVLIIVAGIALQFALAWYIEWYRAVIRAPKPARIGSPQAADIMSNRMLPEKIKRSSGVA
ncbi:OpgC domain-containing protein [Mesorhizobium sp. CAU 1741]|uniref:OpgC family protein n=1 Tax=Mesorhizobium sp. CAU 1741 TaxID=3140366 RepID=UPI00325C029D